MPNEKINLLENWHRRIRIAQAAHYQEANRFRKRHYWLGVPVVVLSTTVGTGVFASLSDKELPEMLTIFLGLISIAAAVLASLQTFLNYSERSSKHLKVATALSSLKKETEENLVLLRDDQGRLDSYIRYVRQKWEDIINGAPLISERVFKENFRHYSGESAMPESSKQK